MGRCWACCATQVTPLPTLDSCPPPAADLMGGLRHGGYFFLNWLTVLLSTLVAQV